MRWGWLVHEVPDRTYLWEIPAPLPPHSLTPPPRHRSRALGQRAPKPTIRSWLGGWTTTPHPLPPHWTLT